MSLRASIAVDQNAAPGSPARSVNRLRHLRQRLRHLRLRSRCSDCLNSLTRSCRRRTNWRCFSRRRYHCRRPVRSYGQTTRDLRGGSAISTRQISELPPTAIPNAAIALVIVSCRAEPQDGALQKGNDLANIRREMWRSRSLIIQAKCGTFAVTDRFVRGPCPMRKVTQ
jgi:hypothetical protein